MPQGDCGDKSPYYHFLAFLLFYWAQEPVGWCEGGLVSPQQPYLTSCSFALRPLSAHLVANSTAAPASSSGKRLGLVSHTFWPWWATSAHQPWPMLSVKGARWSASQILANAWGHLVFTQPPLADYLFHSEPFIHLFIHSCIHSSIDHLVGARKCSNKHLCTKNKTKNHCINHKDDRGIKECAVFFWQSVAWKGRNGALRPGTGVFVWKCLWNWISRFPRTFQASRGVLSSRRTTAPCK